MDPRALVTAIAITLGASIAAPAQQTPFVQQTSSNWPPPQWPTSQWPAADGSTPLTLDGVTVAPENFKVLWSDDKMRLVEVTVRPGQTVPRHADPYPATWGFDTDIPDDIGSLAARGSAPPNKRFPTCATVAPGMADSWTNHSRQTLHYYRVEFKRVDGYGFEQHWREWYPWMTVPGKHIPDLIPGAHLGPPFSKDFPYPMAYDSVKASPKNHNLKYDDAHVRFVEVTGRPGDMENMHGHPYPSIFIFDTNATPAETEAARQGRMLLSVDHRLNPDDPRNSLIGSMASAPDRVPLGCRTMDPQAPHQNRRYADFPIHFYRLEYKRFDGETR